MNNEPVAWMDNYGNICLDIDKKMNQGKITARNNYDANDIPLYIHPAKTLTELSGVEIIGMSGKYDFNYEVDIIDFARAILRKAQEK